MTHMHCTEEAELIGRDGSQTIEYPIDSIDKYIGYERNGQCIQDAYGLAVFQNPDYNIGCYTVTNFLYIFDTKTTEVHSYIEIPTFKNRKRYKNDPEHEILYCCEFCILNGELHIATGGDYGCIYVINIQNSAVVRMLDCHGGPIHCLKANPKHPFIIASCGRDRTIKIWDLRSKSDKCDYITYGGMGGHRMQINTLSWHSSGTKIASGGYDLRVCLWDIPQDHIQKWESDPDLVNFDELYPLLIQYPLFATMMLHTSAIDCILWLDTVLLSKAADGEIICWIPEDDEAFNLDVERLQPIRVVLTMEFETELRWFVQFGYCRQNNHVVCGSTVGDIYFWNLKDLISSRNEIVKKPLEFDSEDVQEMKQAIDENRKVISFNPGAAYNYNYAHLKCCLRNFAFSVNGEYCFALTERGNLIRFTRKLVN